MIKLENTEVLGWEHAIRGMRNPMNSWEKSDSGWDVVYRVETKEERDKYIEVQSDDEYEYYLGPNDQKLMMNLRNAGTDHRKFMRMIVVYVDITAPLYWWKEFDTYKVGTVANSCSTMHKIAAKEFESSDFSHDHLIYPSYQHLQETIDLLNHYRWIYTKYDDLKNGVFPVSHEVGDVIENMSKKDIWWQMIQLLPSSYNQRRTVMLNFEVLANIYKSRKNHKLDEWRELCEWIERLPYSELIVGSESKRFIKIAEDFQKAFQKGLEEGMSIRIQKENVDPEARELIEKALTEDMSLGFDKE